MSAEKADLERDFAIGEWLVSPALNQISRNGTSTRVEPKAMQVLVYLADHPGVVSKDQLISAVWADVFVSDDVLPGCISALRKAFEDRARCPRIIETIHKGGYRLLVPVEPVGRNGQKRKQAAWPDLWRPFRSRRLPAMLGLVMACAILTVAFTGIFSKTRYDSVAVLPFVNAAADSTTQYLSDGIAEQVINDLSGLSGLRVMAWTTVSRFRQPQIDVGAAGRDLGVKAVFTGRLARQGERIVLQAELVDVGHGALLWGQRYERSVSEIAGLEQQLSRDIATHMRVRLADEENDRMLHRYNAVPAAYELYLKGRFFWAKRTKQGLHQGIEYFEQAIGVDPNYALAYAGLADCYNLLDDWGDSAPRDSFPKARAAAVKATFLDPSLAEAHASLAMVRAGYDWDWVGAEQEFKQAIELNPNYPTAHQWYGLVLAAEGRFPEAEAQVKRAQKLDPLSPIINMAVAEVYGWERRDEQAIEQYRKVIALDPSFAGAYGNVSYLYWQKKLYSDALAAIEQKWNLSGDPAFARALEHAYSASGYKAVIRKQLDRVLEERANGQYADAAGIAGYYAELGEEANALRWLEQAYQDHSSGMQFLGVSPDFDTLRSHAEFDYWLGVVGLLPLPGLQVGHSQHVS
ncbi:MAG: winged helix-turn-helix domain-containing protein [Acidobacteria bacterium]|nr:winged helix-turn-helix domain-containing protein [Acidobacteriota bacterium]